jgi:hypothetical protein
VYCTEIITKACLLRCKITYTHITVIIDTSEQGYNAAISVWRDMQNHTHINYSHHWYITTRLQFSHIFKTWYAKSHTHTHRSCDGPIRRTREGGSEWAPIKILLEGDGNSNKINTASNTRLRLTTQVGQAHVAAEVPLDLGTSTQPSDPRNAAENQNSSLQTHTGQAGEHHRSDRSLLVKLSNFH